MQKTTSYNNKMLYQVGTINSLLAGVYEGDVSYYRIDTDGNAHTVTPEMKSPFGVVTYFQEEISYDIGPFDDLISLENFITTKLESKNIIYAISIDGHFNELDLRSEHPQPEGHRPLSETIAKVQTTYSHTIIRTCKHGK